MGFLQKFELEIVYKWERKNAFASALSKTTQREDSSPKTAIQPSERLELKCLTLNQDIEFSGGSKGNKGASAPIDLK